MADSSQTPENVIFYDLDKLAEAASANSKWEPMGKPIRRYRDIMSALNDLRECAEILDALDRSLNDSHLGVSQDPARTVGGALLSQSIILYARATKTKSDHRGFVPIHNGMPPNIRELHALMVELRDNAIAHFGPGPSGSRPAWVREAAVLRTDQDVWSLVFPYSRVAVQTDLPAKMRMLLDYVTPRYWQLAAHRADAVVDGLNRLACADPAFLRLMQSLTFDPWVFFGGDERAVRQFLDSRSNAETFVSPSVFRTEFQL